MLSTPSSLSTLLLLITLQIIAFSPTSRAHVGRGRDETLRSAVRLGKRANAYDDPNTSGGSMLTIVNNTYPAGLSEPINIILSGASDADVLKRTTDNGGFLNYMLAAFMGEECLGQHLGDAQLANLGDGTGNVSQLEELRWDFGNPYIGTCKETFDGGLHLRYWVQNNTGAYFMAVSVEKTAALNHDIPPNGYNLGRDYLVGNITGHQVDTTNVTNQTTFSGSSTYMNWTYQTDVQYLSGLLNDSSDGINHYATVAVDNKPAIDGLVAVLTVKITARGTEVSGAITRLLDPLFGLGLVVMATSLLALL